MKISDNPIKFDTPDYEYNALEEWGKLHTIDNEQEQQKQKQALQLAIQCVNDGTLTLLDSIDSPISQKIREYFKTDTFEINSLWIGTSQHWACPCCGRSKFEISRLGKKNQILAKLVVHHDHIADALGKAFNKVFIGTKSDKKTETGLALIERIAPAFSAYDPILICEDCNNADTQAKRWLQENQKNETGIEFQSFSIGQIRYFVIPHPHSIHSINHELLKELWLKVRTAYKARMELVDFVAKAAVTQDYWYERYPSDFTAIPALTDNCYTYKQPALKWLDVYEFEKTIRQKTYIHESNFSRWRTEIPKLGDKPPPNYLPMIQSLPGCERMWNGLEENWHCPICSRSKFEVVVNIKNKVSFQASKTPFKNRYWNKIDFICGHCHNILAAIKRELLKDFHLDLDSAYDACFPEQLRSMIIARPHSAHIIKEEKANQLIESVVSSIQN